MVAGGAVARVPPDAVGVNPAWRSALGLVFAVPTWAEGASAAQTEAIRMGLRRDLATLAALDPDQGAYLNEVCARICGSPSFFLASLSLFCL
jgi:hypothetical protein